MIQSTQYLGALAGMAGAPVFCGMEGGTGCLLCVVLFLKRCHPKRRAGAVCFLPMWERNGKLGVFSPSALRAPPSSEGGKHIVKPPFFHQPNVPQTPCRGRCPHRPTSFHHRPPFALVILSVLQSAANLLILILNRNT